MGDHIGRGGTGLGLAISRLLVQAMGGELTLKSTRGVGTTVTVRLPARETTPQQPRAAGPDGQERRTLRVLVAEDVPLNAEMMQATLELSGHAAQVVTDGQQALDAVRGAAFDLVLMDVQMPVMDGLAATRAIRALGGAAASVPIVALTAYASRDDLKACLDAGMNDFLTKPLERPKLQEILERWGGTAAESETAPAVAVAEPSGDAGDESVERVGELLARLAAVDRGDRRAIRSLADSLASAADAVGFHGLAERARRLVAASLRSNAEALSALVEDAIDAGRRAMQTGHRSGTAGDGR